MRVPGCHRTDERGFQPEPAWLLQMGKAVLTKFPGWVGDLFMSY